MAGGVAMNALPRIYVVDDDEQMRIVLTRLLQDEYDVMCFATAGHFLEVAPALAAGCLILDLHMPEIDGLEVQRRLAASNLTFPTIMITGLGEVSVAVQAMKAGAVDFVEKPFRRDTIVASVRLAQQRCTPSDRAGDNADNADVAKAHLATLSARELQVLDGLVAGLPNKTIGYDLGVSPRTVEMHRANVMRKMQAGSLSELVRSALAAGVRGKS
jgi:two-component system, LuxR family, response regulator FixJ